MKRLVPVLVVLLALASAHAAEGLEVNKVPQGSIGQVSSHLEAKIENVGYDRVFVALPDSWEVDAIEQHATSYAVREGGLWRIYSSPREGEDLLEEGVVYDITTFHHTRQTTTLGGRQGWWLSPNEGLKISLKLYLPSTGEVDPLKIQKQHPGILVKEWNQEFVLEVSSPGIIEAPWLVEGATLVSSQPPPLGENSKVNTDKEYYVESYREDFEEPRENRDIPEWNEWLPLKNPMASSFISSSNPDAFGNLSQPEGRETIKPVWEVGSPRDIEYEYQWKAREEIEGIRLFRNDYQDLPAWYEWF